MAPSDTWRIAAELTRSLARWLAGCGPESASGKDQTFHGRRSRENQRQYVRGKVTVLQQHRYRYSSSYARTTQNKRLVLKFINPQSNRRLDRFSCFCRSHGRGHQQHTGTQTHLETDHTTLRSIYTAVARIYYHCLRCWRCGLIIYSLIFILQ